MPTRSTGECAVVVFNYRWALFINRVSSKTFTTHTHMTQLLSIETAFLSNSEVKANLEITNVRAIQRAIENGQKKKFEQSLTLSALVKKGADWFKSEEGKRMRKEEGIEWNTEEFALKVYGWQKSFFHKMVKVGGLQTEVVDKFKAECDRLETEGEKPLRTIEALLKYAKQVEETATTDGEGGADGEGGGEGASVETRQKAIATFAFKGETFGMPNVSVRLNSDGSLKTTNSAHEIRQAINVLMSAINNQPEETLEQVMDVDAQYLADVELEEQERAYGE